MSMNLNKISLDELISVFSWYPQLFFLPKGERYRTRLSALLDEHKKKLEKNNPYKENLLFIFLLIFRCPILLSRPPGFEWIADKFMVALDERVLSSYFSNEQKNFHAPPGWLNNEDCFAILKKVVIKLRHETRDLTPLQKALIQEVKNVMNERGHSQTAAILEVGDTEIKCNGEAGEIGKRSDRSISRAFKRSRRRSLRPDFFDLMSPGDHIAEYDSERDVRRLLDHEGKVLEETELKEEVKGQMKKPLKGKKSISKKKATKGKIKIF